TSEPSSRIAVMSNFRTRLQRRRNNAGRARSGCSIWASSWRTDTAPSAQPPTHSLAVASIRGGRRRNPASHFHVGEVSVIGFGAHLETPPQVLARDFRALESSPVPARACLL